jgi:hypothetical protein
VRLVAVQHFRTLLVFIGEAFLPTLQYSIDVIRVCMHSLSLVVEGKPHGALSPAALNCGGSHELQDLPVLSSGYLLDPDLEQRVLC